MNLHTFSTVALCLLLLGCTQKPGTNKGSQGARKIIGVSMLSLQNEFIVNLKDALEKSAGEKNIQLIITDAERSADRQVQQIESFISQGVDAIILNPCEVEASSPAIEKAKAAKIPIVNVNSETKLEPDAFVGSRDEESGEMAMEFIAKKTNGVGNIVIMHGYMGQAAQIKRSIGARKVLSKYPNLRVLAEQSAEWDRARGMTLMENWIQSFGNKINAVFAQNDEMGMGALQALEQANVKDKILLVSIDAISDALQAVKDGRLDATLYQDAKGQAEGAIAAAISLTDTIKLKSKEVFIPFELVTKSNVDSFLLRRN